MTWVPVLTNAARGITRTLTIAAPEPAQFYRARIATPLTGGFALLAGGTIDLNRFTLSSDSFDSSNPLFSTAGQYDPLKHLDAGDIATFLALSNGAVFVSGKRWTSSNGTTVMVYGSVGSSAWVNGGYWGVQPGYLRTNLQLAIPNVLVPPGPFMTPAAGTWNGEPYTYILENANYALPSLNLADPKIAVLGNAVLYVHGNAALSGVGLIRLDSNATLKVYVGGNAQIGGAGIQGGTYANQFTMFGLPSCDSVTVTTPAFLGLIYAPNATCTLGGSVLTGSCIADTIRLAGNLTVHFDESLKANARYY